MFHLLVLPALLAAAPEKPYIPTKVGTVFVYEFTSFPVIQLPMPAPFPKAPPIPAIPTTHKMTSTVKSVKKIPKGLEVVIFTEEENNPCSGSETIHYTDKGAFSVGSVWIGPDPVEIKEKPMKYDPVCFLKLPHKEGNKWIYDPKAKEKLNEESFGPEEVIVPAGKFMAIRVEQTNKAGNLIGTYWYAPDVGMVKEMSPGHFVELWFIRGN